jgi:hypothetical protein
MSRIDDPSLLYLPYEVFKNHAGAFVVARLRNGLSVPAKKKEAPMAKQNCAWRHVKVTALFGLTLSHDR